MLLRIWTTPSDMGAYELLVIAATQVFVFALAVCTIALCGGKKVLLTVRIHSYESAVVSQRR